MKHKVKSKAKLTLELKLTESELSNLGDFMDYAIDRADEQFGMNGIEPEAIAFQKILREIRKSF